jgi:hypothetical protein
MTPHKSGIVVRIRLGLGGNHRIRPIADVRAASALSFREHFVHTGNNDGPVRFDGLTALLAAARLEQAEKEEKRARTEEEKKP